MFPLNLKCVSGCPIDAIEWSVIVHQIFIFQVVSHSQKQKKRKKERKKTLEVHVYELLIHKKIKCDQSNLKHEAFASEVLILSHVLYNPGQSLSNPLLPVYKDVAGLDD